MKERAKEDLTQRQRNNSSNHATNIKSEDFTHEGKHKKGFTKKITKEDLYVT